MAEIRTVELNVKTNNKDVQSEFDNLRKSIQKTTQEVEDLSKEFGDNSEEADKARQELSKLTLAYDSLNQSATDLNASFEQVYGELQPLTTRMGEAEDRLYELALAGKQGTKEYNDLLQAVSGYRKVQMQTDMVVDAAATTMNQKLLGAVGGVASGFEIAEGATALFGVESEKLQETMVKLQSVMAISQGVQGLKEASSSFRALGTSAMNALKGIRTGLAATGIGLFVVALGTIVAYWDDIKEAVSGVSAEQKKLNELSHANFETSKEELETLDAQDNVLKLQGKSEKQILNIKIKKIDAAIQLGKIELENIKKTSKAEEEAAIKNYNLTKSVVDFILDAGLFLPKLMLKPIDLAIQGANKVSEALGLGKLISFDLGKTLEGLEDKASSFIAGSLFNVEEVKTEGEKTRKELEKQIRDLENQRAGFQLTLKELNKPQPVEKEPEVEATKNKNDEIINLEIKKLETLKVLRDSNGEILKGQLNAEVQAELDAALRRTQILEDQANRARVIDEKANSFKVNAVKEGLSIISNLTELFGKKSEKAARRAFQVQKAAQIGSALINTYQSATGAYASQFLPIPDPSSPVRGGIAAGFAIAAGLVNVAKISAQKFEGSSTGGGGGAPAGGGGGGGQMAAPQFNTIGSSGINQLATLQQQPVQAYVVSGEVTSAQSLDRNRVQNATL